MIVIFLHGQKMSVIYCNNIVGAILWSCTDRRYDIWSNVSGAVFTRDWPSIQFISGDKMMSVITPVLCVGYLELLSTSNLAETCNSALDRQHCMGGERGMMFMHNLLWIMTQTLLWVWDCDKNILFMIQQTSWLHYIHYSKSGSQECDHCKL